MNDIGDVWGQRNATLCVYSFKLQPGPALVRNLHAMRHIHFVFVSLSNIYTPFTISWFLTPLKHGRNSLSYTVIRCRTSSMLLDDYK